MKIRGFQSLTLTDYPGKTAAIVFTQGCNFSCPFCHNHQLLEQDYASLMPETVLMDGLHQRRGLLDGLVITGGEPTLQADLVSFAEKVHSLGLLIKLDTNGSRPGVIRALLDRDLVDYIAMDIKAPWARYRQLAGKPVSVQRIRQSVELIAASGVDHEFRTTVVTPLLDEEDIELIRESLPRTSLYKRQRLIPNS